MLILGLDTALEHCSVAISKNGEQIYSASLHGPNSQAEEIAPMVERAMAQAQIAAKDLSRIIVTTGPGSFTGVRVGLAFAKSLALAIAVPCIGVSTLEVFAMQSAAAKAIPLISVAGSVFYAVYEGRKEIVVPTRATDFSFLEKHENDFVLVGPAAIKAQEFYPQFGVINQAEINPFVLASYGAHLPISQKAEPLYLRGADAKLWKGARREQD
ncbi:MAG: O-sialoglycoprotein endopeptidase [Hyphomonadaceae bacterium]|nr:MAG: O-sialoglycoprotein endopeptidase [Hyphomonadaceae bacterium]